MEENKIIQNEIVNEGDNEVKVMNEEENEKEKVKLKEIETEIEEKEEKKNIEEDIKIHEQMKDNDQIEDEEDEENESAKDMLLKKRKKKDKYKSSYIDTEAQEDEEDIEYRESRKIKKHGQKKRRLTKNKYISTFLDTEAQVGDDEEEEDYASSYIDEFEEAKKLEKKKMYETRLKSGTNHLAQAINKLSQRYENEKEIKEDTLTDGETLTDEEMSGEEYFDEGECLSTFDSPKMWLIKLFKNNIERNLAIGIYYKYMKQKDNDYNIKGIYVSDNLKGYIYIEADSLYMLKKFLLGFKFINLNEISIVPVQELTSIFAMCHSKVIIPKVNEYVRIKRGVYMNDIGQIFEVHEKGIYAIVRLIPRISYDKYNNFKKDNYNNMSSVNRVSSTLDENNKNDSYYLNDKLDINRNAILSKSHNENIINEKNDILDEALQFRRKKKKERPLKKFFDREEIEQIGGVIEHGPYPRTIKYQNNIFEENGYLLKKMNIKYLISENANITLTEIRDFNKNNTNEEDINLHLSKSFINKNSLHLFKKNERVKILKGELYNLIGTITSVNENVLTVNPDNLAKEFKFLPSDVTKYFNEGDNVTVINGIHKGKSGLISLLDYKENVALIFSPSLNTELRSSIQDLALSTNNSEGLGGVNTLNGFSIGDLIELSDRQIGVLTYIDKNKHIRVLTNNNKILHTTIGAITSKRSAIGQVCKDENNNVIQAKDTIQIIRGIHKNKVAVVNYIWKNKIFAKINRKIEDNGFVVVDCENCILSGNKNEKKKVITHNNLFRNNNFFKKNNFQSFIGKTVKILTGVYKGLLGDVIDAEKDEFTLLLKIKPKTVRQKRIECAIADAYKDQNIFDEKFNGNENIIDSQKGLEKMEKNQRSEKKMYDSYYSEYQKRNSDKRRGDFNVKYEEKYSSYNKYKEKDINYDNEKKKKNYETNKNKNNQNYVEDWNYENDKHNVNSTISNKNENTYIKEDNHTSYNKNYDNNYNKHSGNSKKFYKRNEEDRYKKNKNEESKNYNKKKDHMSKEYNLKYEEDKNYVCNFDEEIKKEIKKDLKQEDEKKKQKNAQDIEKKEDTSKQHSIIDDNDNNQKDPIWLIEGVMVKVITPGQFFNEIGRIMSITKKNSYVILKIQTEKTSFSIVSDAVVPLKPEKKNDQVIILDNGKTIEGLVIDIHNKEVQVNTIHGNITSHLENMFLYKKYFS
ncbi:transcription elongation factor SPT5, putative [Plasmodium gallinaceum]|uniref:Transcription elongation factor SPT5 n=1 Tax=Plasmodium gallinaceum TaxID=5849 RepID=A0A1J1GML4_PLAGA|nr:transcription elongation factor SPT5, putative [Plasmodium gallinaceum]CRG93688.1 transcription elongation factor SPT5, putative [Plasmodium gallinaceum]